MGKVTTTIRLGGTGETSSSTLKVYPNQPLPTSDRKFHLAQAALAREITTMGVAQHAQRTFVRELNQTINEVQRAANLEATKLIPTMARTLIGTKLSGYSGDFDDSDLSGNLGTHVTSRMRLPVSGIVEWRDLSKRWMNVKKNRYFFRGKSRQLKSQLRSFAVSYPAQLGGIKVGHRGGGPNSLRYWQKKFDQYSQTADSRRRMVIRQLDIQIFPNADRRLFPGLKTGRWNTADMNALLERTSNVLNSEIRNKLANVTTRSTKWSANRRTKAHFNPTTFRPMLGPVTQFWMMHRIPWAIQKALSRRRSRAAGASGLGNQMIGT